MLRKIGLLLLTVFLCLLPRTSLAGDNGYSPASSIDPPIVVGGGWSLFTWTTAAQSFNVEGPFTFSSTGSTVVTVTDDFCPGDQFNVYDFGVLIGTTNAVPSSNNCPSLTPDAALASPVYSHGRFTLGPGNHSITLQTIVNPFNTGGAYLRVDPTPPATPLPPTFLLALLGLSGSYLLMRRRREQITTPRP